MTLKFPAGILVNLGEIPKATYPGKLPSTRMGTANLVRTAFAAAQAHAKKRAGTEDKKPAANLKLEALEPALKGEIPGHLQRPPRRRSDHRAAAGRGIRAEAGPEPGDRGYLIADKIAAAKVPVIVHPTMQRPSSHGNLQRPPSATPPPWPTTRSRSRSAPPSRATSPRRACSATRRRWRRSTASASTGRSKAITLDAAKLLGIDDRFGSIEPGKVADLVLYDGDPFEHATHVTHTLIDGRVIYDRAEYLKLPFARRALPLVSGGGLWVLLGVVKEGRLVGPACWAGPLYRRIQVPLAKRDLLFVALTLDRPTPFFFSGSWR